MTQLETQAADFILGLVTTNGNSPANLVSLTQAYGMLVNASCDRERSKMFANPICLPDCSQVCGSTDPEPCSQDVLNQIPAKGESAPVEDKPKRTRRTKEQIAADEAAAAIASSEAGVEIMTNAEVDSEVEALKTPQETEAEEVQIDDVEPAAPKVTHGQVQELFTRKLTNIAQNKGDTNAFKAKLREILTEMGSPAGISKIPEANLTAFHAKLVNLA